jgi:hypothetical protein
LKRLFAGAAAMMLIAAAPPHQDAAALFRAGQFATAAEAGRAEHTATSLAIAARAALTRAAFLTTDRAQARALVAQGEADADAALKLDPRNYDALFQHASGIGYRATLTNSPKAAGETRTIMLGLAKSDPSRAEAFLGLAAWNGEAVDNLGRFMAGMVLGAKLSAMDANFAEAEKRWPTNPVPFAYHGCLLLRIEPGEAARAAVLLGVATRNHPREVYEATAQKGAAEVLALLQHGDLKGARVLAKKLGSFGKLT